MATSSHNDKFTWMDIRQLVPVRADLAAEFDEAEHPRGPDGKWVAGAGPSTFPAPKLPVGHTIRTEVTASYSGQTNATTAIRNAAGNVVAYVDYVLYDERHDALDRKAHPHDPRDSNTVYRPEVTISMIETASASRRQGLGMALLRQIAHENPGVKINSGMRTDDGGKLWKAWDNRPERLPLSHVETDAFALEFDESEHPRAADGRFGEKSGGHNGDLTADMAALIAHPPASVQTLAEFEAKHPDNDNQDHLLGEILTARGMDQAPKLVDAAAMDALLSDGQHREILRGISAQTPDGLSKDVHDLQAGPWFVGLGEYGNGMYCCEVDDPSERGNAYTVTAKYAGTGGGVVRMTMDPEAKIVNLDDLVRQHGSAFDNIYNATSGAANKGAADLVGKMTTDLGRFAALKGYDAIRVRGNDDEEWQDDEASYLVVLNRGLMTMQRESMTSAEAAAKGDAHA